MTEQPEWSSVQLLTTLRSLRDALHRARLPLDLPDVEEQRRARTEMGDQLEDYVLPRLVQIDAPLLAVVGGSTGAGKSTLVNSLVRQVVSQPGVLRPTTRSPVLVHNPGDAEWFGTDRVLPDLERTTRASHDPEALQLVSSEAVPRGLAILDAPDIDSVEERNRRLATQLLGAADLWLFVTSAARYADQVPWDFLKQAADRTAAVAIVLDRTPPLAVEEVSADLARMLTGRGLRDSPLFVVRESATDADGLLPATEVAEIEQWITGLAEDLDARARVVRQTLEGAVRSLAQRTHALADAAGEQAGTVGRLRQDARSAYDEAVTRIDTASADGTLLRGEVLARWQEFVGTGELLRGLESRVGRLRDRLVSTFTGKPPPATQVSVAVESGLHTIIVEAAEDAAERTRSAWAGQPAGRRLVERPGVDLGRASRDFRERSERAVRDWQHDLLEMVRSEGADKRTTARFLAYGVNGLGVALMIVVFAHTAGLSGAEAGIAGGSAVVGQKLLEAVFGDQAVRTLAERARRDLNERVRGLMDGEEQRFLHVLDDLDLPPESAEELRALGRQIDDLRFAAQAGGARR